MLPWPASLPYPQASRSRFPTIGSHPGSPRQTTASVIQHMPRIPSNSLNLSFRGTRETGDACLENRAGSSLLATVAPHTCCLPFSSACQATRRTFVHLINSSNPRQLLSCRRVYMTLIYCSRAFRGTGPGSSKIHSDNETLSRTCRRSRRQLIQTASIYAGSSYTLKETPW